MGLSFHYFGRIMSPELLPGLIEEVEEIVKVYNWPYTIFQRNFPENLIGRKFYNNKIYGISFTPPGCETIPICFLSNGRFSDLTHLELFGKSKITKEKKYLYTLSVKTQDAGVEIHCFIMELFRYLNNKYFADFNLLDEGRYWETNNKELLTMNFNKYNYLLNVISTALENYPKHPNEDIEAYVIRLLNYISKNK